MGSGASAAASYSNDRDKKDALVPHTAHSHKHYSTKHRWMAKKMHAQHQATGGMSKEDSETSRTSKESRCGSVDSHCDRKESKESKESSIISGVDAWLESHISTKHKWLERQQQAKVHAQADGSAANAGPTLLGSRGAKARSK